MTGVGDPGPLPVTVPDVPAMMHMTVQEMIDASPLGPILDTSVADVLAGHGLPALPPMPPPGPPLPGLPPLLQQKMPVATEFSPTPLKKSILKP